jgi:hypothetical protein
MNGSGDGSGVPEIRPLPYFMHGKPPFAPNQWITMRFRATFIPATGNSTAFSCSLAKAIAGSKQNAMMKTGQGKRQADL